MGNNNGNENEDFNDDEDEQDDESLITLEMQKYVFHTKYMPISTAKFPRGQMGTVVPKRPASAGIKGISPTLLFRIWSEDEETIYEFPLYDLWKYGMVEYSLDKDGYVCSKWFFKNKTFNGKKKKSAKGEIYTFFSPEFDILFPFFHVHSDDGKYYIFSQNVVNFPLEVKSMGLVHLDPSEFDDDGDDEEYEEEDDDDSGGGSSIFRANEDYED